MKYRDLRFELSINEFKEFANAVAKANEQLESSDLSVCVPQG